MGYVCTFLFVFLGPKQTFLSEDVSRESMTLQYQSKSISKMTASLDVFLWVLQGSLMREKMVREK